MPVSSEVLLQYVQDRTTDLRRWLDSGDNSAALMAYLRAEPVDARWLAKYDRLIRDLLTAVGHARRPTLHPGPEPLVGPRPDGR
ncbi:hypothetical protein [Rhodococcus jostii]|uniref:hypothetical protein n=1 Tax=Rhodococcus jostii TaxID=132919 RepID=UPI00362F159A